MDWKLSDSRKGCNCQQHKPVTTLQISHLKMQFFTVHHILEVYCTSSEQSSYEFQFHSVMLRHSPPCPTPSFTFKIPSSHPLLPATD